MITDINLQLFAEEAAGVESAAAAGQETAGQEQTTESTTQAGIEQGTGTGVEQKPAAGEEKVEKAFAARLEKERQKIEAEVSQKAIDKYIASQGYVWNGKTITTEAEYKQAIYEKELQDKGANADDIKKLVEEHPEVKAARELKEKIAKAEKEQVELRAFIERFPDVKPGDIPMEVWQENARGTPLKFAYLDYVDRQKTVEIAKAKANESHASSSMGSTKPDAPNDEGLYTKEQVAAMTTEQVNKNLDKIHKSMARW
jgi:hypothetical protein